MTFSHRGMNVCPICEASLSHHTLYMGNLVPAYTMYHVFPCWQKKEARHRTDFEETVDFSFGLNSNPVVFKNYINRKQVVFRLSTLAKKEHSTGNIQLTSTLAGNIRCSNLKQLMFLVGTLNFPLGMWTCVPRRKVQNGIRMLCVLRWDNKQTPVHTIGVTLLSLL